MSDALDGILWAEAVHLLMDTVSSYSNAWSVYKVFRWKHQKERTKPYAVDTGLVVSFYIPAMIMSSHRGLVVRAVSAVQITLISPAAANAPQSAADNAEWVRTEHTRRKTKIARMPTRKLLLRSWVHPLGDSVDFRRTHDKIQRLFVCGRRLEDVMTELRSGIPSF